MKRFTHDPMRPARGFTLVELMVTLTVFLVLAAIVYRVATNVSQGERVGSTLIEARNSARTAVAQISTDLREAGYGIDPLKQVAVEVASAYRITFVRDINHNGTINPGERITYFVDANANDPMVKYTANPSDRVLRRLVSTAANPQAVPSAGAGQVVASGITQRSGKTTQADVPLFTYCNAQGDTLTGSADDPAGSAYGKTLDGSALGIPGGMLSADLASVHLNVVTEATYKDPWSRKYNNASATGAAYVQVPLVLTGGGLWAIHIDVDTSSQLYPFNAGTTDAHCHQWDDSYDTNVINYFSMMSAALHEIPENITDPNMPFKLIIANADLSPGADITVNGALLPVAAYDDIPIASLPTLTLGGAAGTTKLTELKMTFDRAAGLLGNVHPTVTGSVRGNVPGKLGEWRNGALTIQAIRVDASGTPIAPTNTAISSGGVQGVATGGLLWESTTFWHWKGPAYGQSGWDTYNPVAGK